MAVSRVLVSRARLLTCASVLACACTPRYVPTGRFDPEPPARTADATTPARPSTNAPADDPWAGCRLDVDCGLSEDPQQFAVCEANECVRWDAAQMWSWATTHAPDLATLRSPIALADVPWIPASGKVRLFVDARQLIWPDKPRCVPIDFEWFEGKLVADIPQTIGTKPGTKNAWFYTLQLAGDVSVLGPGRVTSGPEGEGAEATGELQTFGLGLSALVDDALRYTGARYAALIECGSPALERTHCEPKICTACTQLSLGRRSLESSVGFGGGDHGKVTLTGGACDPCPPDPFGPLLPRLRSAVLGRAFVDDMGDDGGPVFHRRAKACNAALKQRSRRRAG